MLRRTFLHIKGINPVVEKNIWKQGVRSWNDLLNRKTILNGVKVSLNQMKKEIQESINALQEQDALYFDAKLTNSEKWRCYKDFRDSCVYFDIETTGLDFNEDSLTVIVAYDGKNIKSFVAGENLDEFAQYIMQFAMCVTFYGNDFDIPFLTRKLDIYPSFVQMDLFYELRDLGYKGGLKSIEREFGIQRGELEDIRGNHAILLWKQYQETKDKQYLETLLAYCCADVLSLRVLADLVYNKKCEKAGFPEEKIKVDLTLPKNPYMANPEILKQIKSMPNVNDDSEEDEESD
jgi:uncharacterized protein YprB with RNaseH-like and TPR domain